MRRFYFCSAPASLVPSLPQAVGPCLSDFSWHARTRNSEFQSASRSALTATSLRRRPSSRARQTHPAPRFAARRLIWSRQISGGLIARSFTVVPLGSVSSKIAATSGGASIVKFSNRAM